MKYQALSCAFAIAALSLSGGQTFAQDYTLSVSVDTSPHHVRNVWLKDVTEKIQKRSNGRLTLKIYESASKFKDSEAAAAVAQGAIDIAMPQYQLISRFVPDCDFQQLPMFYGVDRPAIYAVSDGPLGQELAQRIEKKLGVKVLGRAIDLGLHSVFSTQKALKEPTDLAGLKVRIPGGPASMQRFEAMGASPVQIPWPDVPQALQTGVVGVIWSTHESVASAKLWDAGLKYAMDDRESINQYLPLMNRASYEGLPEDLRQILTTTWDENVDAERTEAARRQAEAKATNEKMGIATSTPDPEQLAAMRQRLMKIQPDLVKTLRMDPDFIARVQASLPH